MSGVTCGSKGLSGCTQQHWCSCILYHRGKATPGVQAKQTGLVMFGESNTCQESCLSEVCVLPPLGELAKGMKPPRTCDTSQLCTCSRIWGTWYSTQCAGVCISTFLRGLLASLPHPQVLWAQLHHPELGVPQALCRV